MGITVPVNPLLRIVSLALPVVPFVKLTDLGMVDTTNQTMIPLFAE
jgi:adenine deaminase